MKNTILIFNLLIAFITNSQNNSLIINNNSYVVLNNNSFIVINQPNQNGIITTGTGGNIVSENEFNKIRWMIDNQTGTYTVPFTTTPASLGGNDVKIPLVLNIQNPGVGNGFIDFSTYETNTDMNTPWVSVVTNMNDADIPNTDNSLNVVDRFWWISAENYTTKPDPNITFYYDDNANEIGGSNTISEANLVAQRFDDISNTWGGDFFNSVNFWGTSNPAQNYVSNVDVGVNDFFATWVLVNRLSILPVDLIDFKVNCNDKRNVNIQWSTASETNNDYFIVEKSYDGINWFSIGEVQGAGNSSSQINYLFTDYDLTNNSFYRLSQVDFNGNMKVFSAVSFNGCDFSDNVTAYFSDNNNLVININASKNNNYNLIIYDTNGKLIILKNNFEVPKGSNQILINVPVSTGMYFLKIFNKQKQFTKKIIKLN